MEVLREELLLFAKALMGGRGRDRGHAGVIIESVIQREDPAHAIVVPFESLGALALRRVRVLIERGDRLSVCPCDALRPVDASGGSEQIPLAAEELRPA